MTSAPHQRDDSDAVDSRPMLSPIRTSLPASNGSSVNNSTRLPFFADQTSANVWPPTQHFTSSGHQSSSSGLVHASLDQPSYHSHHHQQPQSFVSSNIHEFTPHPDMGINASSDPRFNQSLSPVDNNSALQQQQQPPSSSSPVSTKPARGSAARGARGGGKPPVSVSSRNTAGSGHAGGSSSGGAAGGRSSQPKSSRKQFAACGACQHRQLSAFPADSVC